VPLVKQIIHVVLALQRGEDALRQDVAIQQAAVLCGKDVRGIKAIMVKWNNGEVVWHPEVRGRKSRFANASLIHDPLQLSKSHAHCIEEFIHMRQQHGGTTSVPQIQRFLLRNHSIKAAQRAVRYMLKSLGYRWARGQCVKMSDTVKAGVDMLYKKEVYLLELSKALRLESEGKCVVVYLDETYVHSKHGMNYSWFKSECGRLDNRLYRDTGKGLRAIILHAITKDGLLCTKDEAGSYYVGSLAQKFEQDEPSALCLWMSSVKTQDEAGDKTLSDYHEQMNGQMFLKYLEHRLLLTFRALYGNDMEMVLVLDGAAYHRVHSEIYINSKLQTKKDLIKEIDKTGAETIGSVKKDSSLIHHPRADWLKKFPNGPSTNNIKAQLNAFIEKHPERQITAAESLLSKLGETLEGTPNSKKYRRLFTVPTECQTQPIELIWARVKKHVGQRIEDELEDHIYDQKKKSMGVTGTALKQLIIDAFYGQKEKREGDAEWGGITPKLCQACIHHAHNETNKWVELFRLRHAAGTVQSGVVMDEIQRIVVPVHEDSDDDDGAGWVDEPNNDDDDQDVRNHIDEDREVVDEAADAVLRAFLATVPYRPCIVSFIDGRPLYDVSNDAIDGVDDDDDVDADRRHKTMDAPLCFGVNCKFYGVTEPGAEANDMGQCDWCDLWYHAKCLGKKMKEMEDCDDLRCADCELKLFHPVGENKTDDCDDDDDDAQVG